jgi:hypothetical protein
MKHIKTLEEHFKEIFDKVDEALNNPLSVNWTFDAPYIYGSFKIEEKEYLIIAQFIINDFLTFKFKVKKNEDYSTELVNDGSKDFLRVVPTIRDSILYLLDTVKPNGIIFGAMDNSKGRKYVYDRFISEYIKIRKDYDAISQLNGGIKLYTIYLQDLDVDITATTVEFVVDNMKDLISIEPQDNN